MCSIHVYRPLEYKDYPRDIHIQGDDLYMYKPKDIPI